MTGPLEGYRIVDLSQVVSGPLATMLLADQGADVIKVEPTIGGDLTRYTGVPVGGIPPFFANHNRGKRSFAVNLDDPRGLDLVLRLVDGADVFVQNFRPGVTARLGLGSDVLLARNPDLVYVNISGYGATGPYRNRRVYDPIIQGVTGHVAAQLNPELPINDVHRTIVADKSTAYTVAQAVTAALLARERGRARGQVVDIAMIDAAFAFFWSDGMMARTLLDDERFGERLTLAQTMKVQHCATGQLIYFVASDKERHGLFRALNRPEWCEHPQWGTIKALFTPGNAEALGAALDEEFRKWDADELLARLLDEDVPCGPVHTFESLVEDPQLQHNGSIWEYVHPTAGRVRQARPAPRFSETPLDPQPLLSLHGQHTDEVLAGIGVDADTIAALRADGVVGMSALTPSEWLAQVDEDVVEPDLAIVDPHHHLWDYHDRDGFQPVYLLDELLADIAGHRVERTVFVECSWAYRTDGPEELREVGETEYVARVAAESAERGGARIAAIVGACDLRLGDRLGAVLDAHEEAGNGLFRGIRHRLAHDPTGSARTSRAEPNLASLMVQDEFRAGVAALGRRGLTFDAWLYHVQLLELIEMAPAVPGTKIVLDHIGAPLGVGAYAGKRIEVHAQWREHIAELAHVAPNVVVKLGGIGMPAYGGDWSTRATPATSDEIVREWGEPIRYLIDQFGPSRCMFESNFPVDKQSFSYRVLWNAFKKMTADLPAAARADLFAGTATRAYNLG